MKLCIVLHIVLFSALSFSEMKDDKLNYFNNPFMFKPMILSEKPEMISFQEQFKDYPFILYLDDIYQSVYRYSNINTVLFQNENNLLSLLSNYDVSCSRIKLSIKYNFK